MGTTFRVIVTYQTGGSCDIIVSTANLNPIAWTTYLFEPINKRKMELNVKTKLRKIFTKKEKRKKKVTCLHRPYHLNNISKNKIKIECYILKTLKAMIGREIAT